MPGIEWLEHGFYVDLQKNSSGNLKFANEIRSNFDSIEEVRDVKGINAALNDPFLKIIYATAENCAARRYRRIDVRTYLLSDEIVRDDQGKIIEAGRVYWYPEYSNKRRVN